MTSIIFRTPGTLDMRAFTTMGMSAKPNSDRPIGLFGTGLKYAVAVLTRLGATFEVHTGGVRYWFEARDVEFRGSTFRQLYMRRDQWTNVHRSGQGAGWSFGRAMKLPFTTQYGLNWEAWMAFRELYANTLDEGGNAFETVSSSQAEVQRDCVDDSGRTHIIVGNCDEFVKAYRDRASTFLSLSDHPVLAKLAGVEIRQGETAKAYYQGLRAKDLGKPALFTYNYTAAQTLTEDRQLAHDHALRNTLAYAIATSDDEQLIERVITAKDTHWEHGLQCPDWQEPSEAFHRVMRRRPKGVGSGWGGYYGRHDPTPASERSLWYSSPHPWQVDGGDIVDAKGVALFSKPYPMNNALWAKLGTELCAVANAGETVPTPLTPEDATMKELKCDFSAHVDAQECPETHEEIRGAFRRVVCNASGRLAHVKEDSPF